MDGLNAPLLRNLSYLLTPEFLPFRPIFLQLYFTRPFFFFAPTKRSYFKARAVCQDEDLLRFFCNFKLFLLFSNSLKFLFIRSFKTNEGVLLLVAIGRSTLSCDAPLLTILREHQLRRRETNLQERKKKRRWVYVTYVFITRIACGGVLPTISCLVTPWQRQEMEGMKQGLCTSFA